MVKRSSENIFAPYFFIFIITLILFLGEKFGITSFIRYPLEKILIPPRRILYSLKMQVLENSQIFFDKTLRQKINKSDQLTRELTVLQARVQLLEEENNSLRKQLEAPLPAQWNFIPAQVLGKERFLLIDKGTKDKVAKDMVVISENIFIGKVTSVSPKTAQVMILTDPDLKIPAITNKNAKGLLVGNFGNKIMLSRVLQRDSLNSFDLVLTSGEEEKFPANLLVGKIDEVNVKQGEVYKEASIMPLIDYDKLKYVFVVTSY